MLWGVWHGSDERRDTWCWGGMLKSGDPPLGSLIGEKWWEGREFWKTSGCLNLFCNTYVRPSPLLELKSWLLVDHSYLVLI